MDWMRTAVWELFGLFVDDAPFTVAIVAWLGAGSLFLPRLDVAGTWDAPLLFLGCTIILVESVRRTALRHRRQQKERDRRI